jgi:hypothetical protein
MSTWHQQQRPVQLWHPTQWTVVTDPPNMMMTVQRFDTSPAADDFVKRGAKHTYLILPQGDK